ncbi:MAG: hypothetical protein GEU93_06070 [Propionibacteriales bacterium]|nr:hypothetical protein [Propionibacteriales bacterium]
MMSEPRRTRAALTGALITGITLVLAGALVAVLVLLADEDDGADQAGERPPGSSSGVRPGVRPGDRPVKSLPKWEQVSPIGTPRDDFAHVVIGDEIWTFGGMTGARATRLVTTEIYDTGSDTWRSGPDLPKGLASFEGVAIGDEAYLFGGLNLQGRADDFSAVLDTTTGEWRRLPALPHARYGHDVDLVGGKIHVVGGTGNDTRAVAEVDVFDPETRTWSQAAPMPAARSNLDIVPVRGELYAVGGWLGARETRRMQIYDPATDSWRDTTPLPRPMARGGVAFVDGKLYASHHEWSAVYDLATRQWSRANPLTVSRHGLGYIAVGSKIYGIGGCTPSPLRDVTYVDVLDLSE